MGTEQHDFIPAMTDQEGPQPGPSWGNPRWAAEMAGADGDLASAMDPTQMRIDAKAAVATAAKAAGKPSDPASVEKAASLSIAAMTLVRLYRVRGHMAADLDPLDLSKKREIPADLGLAFHELAGREHEDVYVGGVLGLVVPAGA